MYIGIPKQTFHPDTHAHCHILMTRELETLTANEIKIYV